MKADYVHKDTLTATDYVELNKNNELIMSYNQELQKENKQLKERIEYLERSNNRREDIILEQRQEINNLETQQKEFIKYLENMLDDENDIFSVVRVKDALQKYREIIGVSDEH